MRMGARQAKWSFPLTEVARNILDATTPAGDAKQRVNDSRERSLDRCERHGASVGRGS